MFLIEIDGIMEKEGRRRTEMYYVIRIRERKRNTNVLFYERKRLSYLYVWRSTWNLINFLSSLELMPISFHIYSKLRFFLNAR